MPKILKPEKYSKLNVHNINRHIRKIYSAILFACVSLFLFLFSFLFCLSFTGLFQYHILISCILLDRELFVH